MYDELHIAWKAEKSTQRLQPLPRDFYQRASKYFETLSHDTPNTNSHDLPSRLTSREKEMATRLLEELRQTRRIKIFQAAQTHTTINSADITEEEEILVTAIKGLESNFPPTERTLSSQGLSADTEKFVVVRFLQSIPEIAGIDLRIYGPFKKEDVASIPLTNALALVSQGAAKIIEFKKIIQENIVNNK